MLSAVIRLSLINGALLNVVAARALLVIIYTKYFIADLVHVGGALNDIIIIIIVYYII